MKYKADSQGNFDKEKCARDVAEAFKKGDMNMTVEVDMTDYIHSLIQKALREWKKEKEKINK